MQMKKENMKSLMIQHVFFSKVWRNALINDQISSLFIFSLTSVY